MSSDAVRLYLEAKDFQLLTGVKYPLLEKLGLDLADVYASLTPEERKEIHKEERRHVKEKEKKLQEIEDRKAQEIERQIHEALALHRKIQGLDKEKEEEKA